jgi:excisionase family DNA binding protein
MVPRIPESGGLSTAGAARLLGVSESLVRKLTRRGALPCVNTPLGRLYDENGVRAYGEKRRQLAGPADTSATDS